MPFCHFFNHQIVGSQSNLPSKSYGGFYSGATYFEDLKEVIITEPWINVLVLLSDYYLGPEEVCKGENVNKNGFVRHFEVKNLYIDCYFGMNFGCYKCNSKQQYKESTDECEWLPNVRSKRKYWVHIYFLNLKNPKSSVT